MSPTQIWKPYGITNKHAMYACSKGVLELTHTICRLLEALRFTLSPRIERCIRWRHSKEKSLVRRHSLRHTVLAESSPAPYYSLPHCSSPVCVGPYPAGAHGAPMSNFPDSSKSPKSSILGGETVRPSAGPDEWCLRECVDVLCIIQRKNIDTQASQYWDQKKTRGCG
jgi:hypothetical protein